MERTSDARPLCFIAQIRVDKFWVVSRALVVSPLVCSKVDRFVEVEREAEFQEVADDFIGVIIKQLAPEGKVELTAWERDSTSSEVGKTRLVYGFKQFD